MGSDDTRIITSLIPNDVIYCYTKTSPSLHCASNAVQNSNFNIFIYKMVWRVGLMRTQINSCHTPHQSASIFFLFILSEHANPCKTTRRISATRFNENKYLMQFLLVFQGNYSKSWIPEHSSTCDKWIGAVSNFTRIIHKKLYRKWRETRKVWQFYCTFTI